MTYPNGKLWFTLLCAALLVACGARPGMEPEFDGSAVGSDAANAPQLDASAPLPPCDWVAGPVYQLTSPPSDKGLHDLAVTERGVLVAWKVTNPDPPHDNTRWLQRITFLGAPDGAPQALFPPPRQLTLEGGIRLAPGQSHVGATVWDDAQGCLFRRTDPLGNPLDTPTWVASHHCEALRTTAQGYSLFTTNYASQERRLVILDAAGLPAGESASIPVLEGEVFWWSIAELASGDLLVAGMPGGFTPTAIALQRISPLGAPLSAPETLTLLDVPASRVRLINTGHNLLAGWLETAPDGPSSQHQWIVLQPLDLNGQVVGPAIRHEAHYAFRDGSWSLTMAEGQVLAAYVEPREADTRGDVTIVRVQPLTLLGAPDGPAIALRQERFARRPVIRQTPQGVIVGYTAFPGDWAHEIFTGAVRCNRPR